MQLRCFGPQPLTEDNTVRSKPPVTLNGRVGLHVAPKMNLALEGFKLTSRKASAIDDAYTARLPGEPAKGVADIHFHPIESRSFRLSLAVAF